MNQWATSAERPQARPSRQGWPFEEIREFRVSRTGQQWSLERFSQEQIRGLVRRVFLSGSQKRVRSVVFTAIEPQTDVRRICRMVGEALAIEDLGDVAVVGNYPRVCRESDASRDESPQPRASETLRQRSARVRPNLWLVPGPSFDATGRGDLHTLVTDVQREFDFAIYGPSASISLQATALAQLADGLILVLSEARTRRAAARELKRSIEAAQVHILGTVLSDRQFPIPEKIYRHL